MPDLILRISAAQNLDNVVIYVERPRAGEWLTKGKADHDAAELVDALLRCLPMATLEEVRRRLENRIGEEKS